MDQNIQEENRKVVPISSADQRVPEMVVTLSTSKERMNQLQEFVENGLERGLDYGVIDGFSKPTLLKPGAEKLCDVFGFMKTVEVVNRIEQWEVGIFAYEVKVTLTQKDTGIIEAEGIGSCNSKESSFKHQDPYTIVNTVLKMAKKRALIDAVLTATRSSGLFTQDIEDFPKNTPKGGDEPVTVRQLNMIFKVADEVDLHPETAKEMLKSMYYVDRAKQLTKHQASDFIQNLNYFKNE
ncbi:hypothetical protein LGQ02_20970 [Bacillus shivajii]|uniref:hypothetical protein n=1 Tax=Bacillus shivajii TaxID=1983719 RepID=UPI001CF971B1|nr:hypothetical protein [Bacillus shivajii]UCZ53211.1 hypothetical protein LGQ02_20970 [Bacillus shivajii]